MLSLTPDLISMSTQAATGPLGFTQPTTTTKPTSEETPMADEEAPEQPTKNSFTMHLPSSVPVGGKYSCSLDHGSHDTKGKPDTHDQSETEDPMVEEVTTLF